MGIHVRLIYVECGCRNETLIWAAMDNRGPVERKCSTCGAIIILDMNEIKDQVRVERPGVRVNWH